MATVKSRGVIGAKVIAGASRERLGGARDSGVREIVEGAERDGTLMSTSGSPVSETFRVVRLTYLKMRVRKQFSGKKEQQVADDLSHRNGMELPVSFRGRHLRDVLIQYETL